MTVYYEFFNPGEHKTITVGFEAMSPSGDVDASPVEGKHPHMYDFTVEVNGNLLPFKIAYVEDSLYAETGEVVSLDLETYEGKKHGNYVDFFYVYHFDATFKKGKNIIKHTYTYDLSGGICFYYNFEYVLTAANRWGNQKIDDFTLIIDCGDFESFDIMKTFFDDNSAWIINGIGKDENTSYYGHDYGRFHIQKGTLIFQRKNFSPKGELFVNSTYCDEDQMFKDPPYSYYGQSMIQVPEDDFGIKVMRNLPFARRGYIFKTEALQAYYDKVSWYTPDPNYVPNLDELHELELEWIEQFKQ